MKISGARDFRQKAQAEGPPPGLLIILLASLIVGLALTAVVTVLV